MAEPLVSVCMPVYNRADLVVGALRSLLTQTHRNLEILVVDDGSTDETPDVIEGLGEERIRLVRREVNRGNLACRNEAFELCEGDFIAVMDSDDLCHPERIERQVAALREGYELCGSSSVAGPSIHQIEKRWFVSSDGRALAAKSLFGSPFANPSTMMTREFLDRSTYRFDEAFYPAADYHALALAIVGSRARATAVEHPLVFRRLHPKTISSENDVKQQHAAVRTCEAILDSLDISETAPKAAHLKFVRGDKLLPDETALLADFYHDALMVERSALFGSASAAEIFDRFLGGTAAKRSSRTPVADKRIQVSYVVPVYNTQAYLRECVDSIFRQTGFSFEVILVNDGSTDGSGQMCDALTEAHPEIRVVHQENRGLSGARNTGVENAKGNYIFFLDSDDYLAPGGVARLWDLALEKQADVVAGSTHAFDDATGEQKPRFVADADHHYTADIPRHYAKRSFGYPAWNKLIRASLAERLSFVPGLLHEDEIYCVELFSKARTVTVSKTVSYLYRQRGGSITSEVRPANVRDLARVAVLASEKTDLLCFTSSERSAHAAVLEFKSLTPRWKLGQYGQDDRGLELEVEHAIAATEAAATRARIEDDYDRFGPGHFGWSGSAFGTQDGLRNGRGFVVGGTFIPAKVRHLKHLSRADALTVSTLLSGNPLDANWRAEMHYKANHRNMTALRIIAYTLRKNASKDGKRVFPLLTRLGLVVFSAIRR